MKSIVFVFILVGCAIALTFGKLMSILIIPLSFISIASFHTFCFYIQAADIACSRENLSQATILAVKQEKPAYANKGNVGSTLLSCNAIFLATYNFVLQLLANAPQSVEIILNDAFKDGLNHESLMDILAGLTGGVYAGVQKDFFGIYAKILSRKWKMDKC